MVIKTAEKYMREVAVELRINPIGQLIPYEMYIDMLSGDFTPNWNVNELLKNDYHQGVTVLRFAQFKPDEISDYNVKLRAQENSKLTRKYDKAKMFLCKKPRSPPDTYQAVTNMFAGALRFYATWFGMDSQIKDDYLVSLGILEDLVNFESQIAWDTWRTISWLAGNCNQ